MRATHYWANWFMWTWYMTFRCIFSNNGCASNEVKGSVFDHQGVRVIDSSQAISNPIHWGHYKWEHLLPRCMMMARANSRIPLGTMRWPGSWSVCCTTRISPRHSHLWCHWWIDHKKRLTRAHLSHMWWSNNCNITHFSIWVIPRWSSIDFERSNVSTQYPSCSRWARHSRVEKCEVLPSIWREPSGCAN